jgi:ACS family tartrate transporter-like MFS transporter
MSSGQTGIMPSPIEVSTVRKIQRRIIPYVFVLYIVAFLDRVNIGFAALSMNKDLGITAEGFGLLSGIFFLGYFLFEIPSNLLLHKIGARVWIARIMISWGIVAGLTGLAQNVVHIYILRFLLGLAEAGFFPGIILYLTYWFRQRDHARAVALFMTGIPVCSIIGGPISGLILDHVHWIGLGSWRWLLILEALPAIALGLLTYALLPSRLSEATFLTQDEKTWLAAELEAEEKTKLHRHKTISAGRALANGRVWHLALIYLTLIIGLYSITFWMPQVVKTLSTAYSNTNVGVLVMIPHLVGLLAMVLVSRRSDRTLERRYHAAIPAIIGGLAFWAVGATVTSFVSILLLSIAAAGVYSFFGPFWSLPNQFLIGSAAASGIALINSIGNLGGFVGPYVIGLIGKSTGKLHWGLACAGFSLLISASLVLALPMHSQPYADTRLATEADM